MLIIRVTIPRLVRQLFYVTLSVSWLSGVAFFVFNQWVTVEGDFGPAKHPLQFWWLSIHGLAAFMVMMLFGAIAINHVASAWKIKRQRGRGLTLLVALLLQIASAYLLYYLSDEGLRALVVYWHLAMGLLLPILLFRHIVLAVRLRREQQLESEQRRAAMIIAQSQIGQ
jgi:hypothetical protein